MGSVCRALHSTRRVFALGNSGVLLRQLSEMCCVDRWRAVGDQFTGKVLPVSKLIAMASDAPAGDAEWCNAACVGRKPATSL